MVFGHLSILLRFSECTLSVACHLNASKSEDKTVKEWRLVTVFEM